MTINIISEYTPIEGGGGVLAEELVKRLLERGHVVNVITWGDPSAQQSKEHPNLTVYRICKPVGPSPWQKLKFGCLAGKRAKTLNGIIHGHIFFFPLEKRRTIYTFHLTQLGQLRALRRIKGKSLATIISTMFKKLYLNWEKYIINNSSTLIAISETVNKELIELGAKAEQVELMANTINLENYHRVNPRKATELKLKYNGPKTKIVFSIGRLLPIKGFQDVIKAVSLLGDGNVKLLIAGDGGHKESLVKLVEELELEKQVVFLGKVPKDKVKKYYSMADVTVVPSLYDAFGLVILEAMACESPLVCTNVCDFPLIAGKAAVYAQPQNPKDLAEKIRFVLDNPKKAKEMAKYGLKKVKNYAWESYIKKLEQIYEELDLGEKKASFLTTVLRKMRVSAINLNNSNILNLLEKNERGKLLDLGCEKGTWTVEVAKKVDTPNYYGLDIVGISLKEARLRGVIAKRGDLNQKLPYENNFFDCVHSNQVIEHLYNVEGFINEIHRVLKKDAYCVVSTENLASWCNIFALVLGWQPFSITNISSLKLGVGNPMAINRGVKIRYESWKHVRVDSVRALIELFEIHGFKVEKVVGAGYFPLPAFLGEIDVRHSHFITIKARKF